MTTLFFDNSKANSIIRNINISVLKEHGFLEGGAYCTSGNLYISELRTMAKLVFGIRCNVSGKRQKYFSLAKNYKTKEDAIKDFKIIKLRLKANHQKEDKYPVTYSTSSKIIFIS